jgi:hypothetical protein
MAATREEIPHVNTDNYLSIALGSGGGYYGHRRWGYSGGAGMGLGTILLILLIVYLLGGLR